jgi:tetratricopeptide (TPR) repeat protein
VRVFVTREGYFEGMETADTKSGQAPKVNLILRERGDQPDQLPLAALLAGVMPGLRAAAASEITPDFAESSKTSLRFAEGANVAGTTSILAQVVERQPSCIACRTLLGLALLERGSWWSALQRFAQAATLDAPYREVGGSLIEAGARRSEPFLILGVIESWRNQPRKAARFFLQALEVDPHNPLTLQELGREYLLDGNEEAADKYLTRALKAGASKEAHFLRARALLAESIPKEAAGEMEVYLDGRQPRQLPGSIRGVWNMMTDRLQIESTPSVKSVVEQSPAELVKSYPELQGLQLAQGQELLGTILRKIGEGMQAFFRSFPNTSSLEEIRSERLHPNGKVGESLKQHFEYLCLAPPDRAMPGFEEYRRAPGGGRSTPGGLGQGFMLTQGFTSASLPFHPFYQPESRFRYLGRQRAGGRETYVIAFAQRPEKAKLLGSFKINQIAVSTLTQGLAWVDAGTYQMLRLRTDLLNPLQQVRLDQETTEITFSEVHFKETAAQLWLPQTVTVTVQWAGKLLRNIHDYSGFRLFHVQTAEKRKPWRLSSEQRKNRDDD